MSITITSSHISKLEHDIQEIRVRALRDIESKVSRAILFEDPIDCIFSDLLKGLIRWFSKTPICEEETVLNIIIVLLGSIYGPGVIDYFGTEKIEREINKIRIILANSELDKLVLEINEILQNHEREREAAMLERRAARKSKETVPMPEIRIDLTTLDNALDDVLDTDYVKCWNIPQPLEVNSLVLLKDSLKTDTNLPGFKHALKYVHTALRDFPTEYFLQPPYIYKSLLALLNENNSKNSSELLSLFIQLTKSLIKRKKYRELTVTYNYVANDLNPYNQISLQKYCFDLINLVVKNLKINVGNVAFVVSSLNLLNELIKLLKFVDINSNNRDIFYIDFLNELATLARYYRTKYEETECDNNFYRTIYINLISCLIKFNNCGKISVVTGRGDNFNELRLVLLDMTIRVFYPKMYNAVKNIIGPLDANSDLSILFEMENALKIPIEILKNNHVYSEIELIKKGELILETINTVKSFNILKLLFNSVCNNIDYINNDDNLSEIAENLFISLLTVSMAESKKLMYKEAGDRIKFYFNSFMDGEIGINKCNLNKNSNRLFNLGIPVTSRILSEIICFGYKSEEFVIRQNSETILILILRGKTVLGSYWNLLIESITSIFPLLQCFADPQTNLGQAIIDLFDPNFDLNEDEIMKGNIRFLFSKNYDVRKIGLMRTFSVLRSHPKCNQFLPNISNVYDTVPNEVCIVNNLYDYKIYEIDCDVSTVIPLLELLKSNDVQPSVRKSTLVQLNLMAGNSVINRYMHDNKGWLIAISCLESALLENHTFEYPDAAIPCIGILAKIALQIPEFRHQISNEPNLYFLILRALFLFHLNISLKLDCAVLLFLFLHSNYVIGARNLTVPFILKNISIPINTDFYRKHTNKASDISKLDLIFVNNENTSEPNLIFKYIRLIFAYLWFDENFVSFYNDTPEYKTKFKFEPKLKLRPADVKLIKSTSNLQNLRNIFQNIENTTNHENFTASMHCLELLLLVNTKNAELFDNIDLKKLKFYNVVPNTIEDERLFIIILKFIRKLLNYTANRYNNSLSKLIKDLKKDESTFSLIILNSSNYSIDLFTETCQFLSDVITHFLVKYRSITTASSDEDRYLVNIAGGIVNKWFCIISKTFKTFHLSKAEEFEKLQSLISVFRILTSSKLLECDPVYNRSFINHLFNYIASTKSLSQSGADFTKHCLFCIGNLIEDGAEIKLKYYRLLSSLASHNDFEIRSCAWSLLDKLAMNIGGAENIISELAYLPGGIHACCLSTVLDINEVPIVRLLAAGLFSNLISFGERNGRGLNIKVTPRCNEQHDARNDDPIKLIEEIVQRQKLFVRIRESIKYFNVSEVLIENVNQPITACEVITGYCIILSNLIDIKEGILERHDVLSTVYDIAVLLSYVPIVPTRSSLDMVVEISRLLSRCFSSKKYTSLLDRISTHDFAIMESLGILLNLGYLCEYPSQYLSNCCVSILLTIRQLTTRRSGYENYCRFWQRDNNASIFLGLLIYCVKNYKSLPELSKAALKLLRSIYTTSQADNYDFETFVDIFDKVGPSKDNQGNDVLVIDLTDDTKEQNGENLNLNVSCQEVPKPHFEVVKEIPGVFGTELLFKRILRLFDSLCLKDKPDSGVVTWTSEKRLCYQTMQVMLKCSLKLRLFAITSKLMDKIIDRLTAIHDGLGMTCTDYIRKYGDAKKQPIVSELQELLNLITYWYSNHIFDDEVQIYNLFRNFLDIWPWTTSNSEIQFTFFNCLLILSEKSIPVCRRISSATTGRGTTGCVIQKIIQKVSDETVKVKTPSGNTEFLDVSLRLLANCCSCIEGRLQMSKHNVLDNISRLHPAFIKTHKGWNEVLYQWLKFWEVFSRYPEGGALRHIPLICSLIIKTTIAKIRVEALKIIRNMCFISANRSGILSSEDILYIIRYILEQDQPYEKYIAVTCVWKLIANSSKGKSVIKNSSIPSRLRKILKEIVSVEENLEQNEFSSILAITLNILDG